MILSDKPVVVVLPTNGELTFTFPVLETTSVGPGETEQRPDTTRPARGSTPTGAGRGSGDTEIPF